MTAFHQQKTSATPRISLVPTVYEKSQITQIRVHVYIPKSYIQQPVISRLISEHGLVVNITKAMLGENTGTEGCFDLELRGTVLQIRNGLAYLQSLNLKIVGKPNTDGDGWHY